MHCYSFLSFLTRSFSSPSSPCTHPSSGCLPRSSFPLLHFLLCLTSPSPLPLGGCISGTRFRPLSLELPQPLFPIAGSPWLQHHIEAIVKVYTESWSIHFVVLKMGFWHEGSLKLASTCTTKSQYHSKSALVDTSFTCILHCTCMYHC